MCNQAVATMREEVAAESDFVKQYLTGSLCLLHVCLRRRQGLFLAYATLPQPFQLLIQSAVSPLCAKYSCDKGR